MKQEIIPKISLTDKAASKLKSFLEKEKKKAFRLAVVKGGCSGYSYEMSVEDNPKEGDIVLEEKGVSIFVGREGSDFLDGSTVDYFSSLTDSGFKILNPNVKRTCGCGHSVG